MSTLSFTQFQIPGAPVGGENGLPDVQNNTYIHAGITVSERVPEADRKWIGKGMIRTLLPYTEQNQYGRTRAMQSFRAAVLENEYLRATFIPELGGRLWSLYHKKENRELLYANTCFQPANLALRNAWFSGGVEWNVGIKGHNPLTCSPLFAEKLTATDGEPMLRMYELERIRGVVYTVTARLDRELLLVRTTIENPGDETFMYWWSNIAVPETADTRVIVPASEAFYCTYAKDAYQFDFMPIPQVDGTDMSYASRVPHSLDFFFRIPDASEKWITAVDGTGAGLAQCSTPLLKGRKMFLWGQCSGGRHWNEWLSDSKKPYIEIQAGLMRTQMEHFPMAAHAELSFMEAYGLMHGDPRKLHSEDYATAIAEASAQLHPWQARLDETRFAPAADGEIVYTGSGYGALEELRRGTRLSRYVRFPAETITGEAKYWQSVWNNTPFETPNPAAPITTYMCDPAWKARLEEKADKTWYDCLQLGVAAYAQGDESLPEATAWMEKSVALCENPWALRNLAQFAFLAGRRDRAISYTERAMRWFTPALWKDGVQMLLKCEAYDRALEWIDTAPEVFRMNGRTRLMNALALAKLGRIADAEAIVSDHLEVADIREGEYTLSDLWTELHRARMIADGVPESAITPAAVLKKYPLPASLDFRMHRPEEA